MIVYVCPFLYNCFFFLGFYFLFLVLSRIQFSSLPTHCRYRDKSLKPIGVFLKKVYFSTFEEQKYGKLYCYPKFGKRASSVLSIKLCVQTFLPIILIYKRDSLYTISITYLVSRASVFKKAERAWYNSLKPSQVICEAYLKKITQSGQQLMRS